MLARSLDAVPKLAAGAPRVVPAVAEAPSAAGRSGRQMSRTYAVVAVAGVLPFLLVVVALAVYQFAVQRQQLVNEIETDVIQHNVLLGGILKNVRDHVRGLATWAEAHLIEFEADPARAVPAPKRWPQAGGRLIAAPGEPPADPADPVLGAAHRLLPHMRLAHEAMPYLRWSWLVEPDAGYMSLFPVFSQPAAVLQGGRDGGAELLALLASDALSGAAISSIGARDGAWSEAYLDPMSGTWVVAHQMPVAHRGERGGLVGTAVLLDFLTGFLRAFDYPAGRLLLVDDAGQVLAASEDPAIFGYRLQALDDLLPADLAGEAARLLRPSGSLQPVGDSYVFTQRVAGTPWRLLFVAGAGEIDAVLWPRFIPYGIILAGLIITLLLAHHLRERLIIRPALGLVEFIRAESQDEAPTRPDLPPVWRPWIDAVAEAFAAKRASVERIRDDAERLQALAGAHPVPLAVVPLAGTRLVYANRAFADLFRVPQEALPGADTRTFYDDPTARGVFLRRLRREGHVRSFEGSGRRSDGSTFPASVTSQLIQFEGQEAIVTAVLDLTDQKAAETEIARQREALHQSEKLNALGSMLASVAHELNNPLSVVVGYATMMRDLAPDPSTRDRAVRIHAAAERCARIVRTFLAMARRKPDNRGEVRVEQVIESALEIAGYGLRTTDISVDVEVAPDLPAIHGDPDQLTLVVMNLIVNAQHALQTMPLPRRLEIIASAAGSMVQIRIADNGPGIAPAVQERIFEPFFTTKPQGVGTGIGLSVCRNIVLAHDGTIEALSPAGGGSVFVITLPGTPALPEPPPAAPCRPGDAISGRILVVEDEEEVADMLIEMLGRDGHEIEVARSGRDALRRLEERPVDLIISDLHMPDLDGPQLYHALLERRPALAPRMVFMTGDVLAADVNGFLSESGVPVFDKPIDPYEIRTRVRDRLERLAARRD